MCACDLSATFCKNCTKGIEEWTCAAACVSLPSHFRGHLSLQIAGSGIGHQAGTQNL